MAMKEWVKRLQPLRYVFVFCLTLTFFVVVLVVSHVTHALTLLVDAYNCLCNLMALFGSFITYKFGNSQSERGSGSSNNIESEEIKSLASLTKENKMCGANPQQGAERRLMNTFGWARVDVLVILINCVFLSSLYFSVLVESFQTLIHISHLDEMHHPIPVLCLGITSVLTNLVSHLLIGGYTFNQGSFQNSANSSTNVSSSDIKTMEVQERKRQGLRAVCRDLVGGVIVIICALLVYWSDKSVAKYIDPLMSIVSVCLLMILNFPFMKKSCFILLQTIPDHINIESLYSQLLTTFPVIINVHDLHVWQLTVDKTYTTVHIIFYDPKDYLRITNDVITFFNSKGITNVTIQPEFFKDLNSVELVSKKDLNTCLVPCVGPDCLERHCCTAEHQSLESIIVEPQNQKKEQKKTSNKTEIEKSESKISSINTAIVENKTEISENKISCIENETLSDTKESVLSTEDLVSEVDKQDSHRSVCSDSVSTSVSESCVKS